jgi:hypothetical protein
MIVTSQPAASTRVLSAQPENIPELLREQPQWLCWKAGPTKPNGKFDKVPVDPRTGRNINGRDRANWLTFARAMDACCNGLADGIGFALSDQHPIVLDGVDFYLTVADFDQSTANMDELLVMWRELGKPFVEVSPSNNGLHMWGLCRSPLRGGNAGGGRELYSGGRFVTMTGVGAKGTFGECPGFIMLEQQWFPPRAMPAVVPPPPPVIGLAELPSNLVFDQTGNHWFDRLSPDDKNACLAAMLQMPAVIALADMPDDAPSPNWRTVVAACVRSGAPDAYNRCRTWAQTSQLFDPHDFDSRWGSYARG